jgi:hypothetical protein
VATTLSQQSLFYLFKTVQDNPQVDYLFYRNFLSSIFPAAIKWTAKHIWYIRVSIIKKLRDLGPALADSYEHFKKCFPQKSFLSDLDLNTLDANDYTIAKELWLTSNNKPCHQHEDNTNELAIILLLKSLKTAIDGFDFRLMYV